MQQHPLHVPSHGRRVTPAAKHSRPIRLTLLR
jgi:hypothetical protein